MPALDTTTVVIALAQRYGISTAGTIATIRARVLRYLVAESDQIGQGDK